MASSKSSGKSLSRVIRSGQIKKYYESLINLATNLKDANDFHNALNPIKKQIQKVIGYNNVWVYIFNDSRTKAIMVSTSGDKSEFGAKNFPELTITGDKYLEELLEAKDIIIIPEAADDPRSDKEIVALMKLRTVISVPIILFDRKIGYLGTGTVGDEGVRVPNEDEIQYLKNICSFTAILFDRIYQLQEKEKTIRLLANREKHFRTLIEQTPLGVAVLKGETFYYVNNRLPAMLGAQSAEEMINTSIAEFFGPIAKKIVKESPIIKPIEMHGKRRDGSEIVFEIQTSSVDLDGETLKLAFMKDLSEIRRAEEERKKLENQMLYTQKLESLGVLAGGIAHDFNNILMTILGNTDLAMRELSPLAPAMQHLREIEKASQHASDLARQMLAYSGKGRFVIEPINLSEIVHEMTHMLEVSISKKANLKYNFGIHLPAMEGDATQIQQIILNLIINASEAFGDNSGIISISTGTMFCDSGYLESSYLDDHLPSGTYVFIEVADTGMGMDEETRTRLFDPFFTTKFTGRGLGLSAVLGIVRGHKGAIKIYSEPGRGTTFKVLFPVSKRVFKIRNKITGPGLSCKLSGTILVADDEESVLTVARLMLEKMGLDVITAVNGLEALDTFSQHISSIDIVLLDLTMPKLDGEQVFREMRRLKPNVSVVISSGYNEQEVIQRFVGKGLAGFIQKPYQMDKLAEILQKGLQKKENDTSK